MLANAREPGIHLVRELGAKTGILAFVVVDSVVELAGARPGEPGVVESLEASPGLGDYPVRWDGFDDSGVDLRAAAQRLFDPELLELSL